MILPQIFHDLSTYCIDFVLLGNGIQANHLSYSVFLCYVLFKIHKSHASEFIPLRQHLFDYLCGRCKQNLCFRYLLCSFTSILFASSVIFFSEMLNVTKNFGITDLLKAAENGIYYIQSWRNGGTPPVKKSLHSSENLIVTNNF